MARRVQIRRGMKSHSSVLFGVFLVLLPAVSGCAYFVRKDCQSTDWRQAGYEEGAAGGKRNAFRGHQQRCAEAEAHIPEPEWNAGFAEGHRSYCSEDGGRKAGAAGRRYTGVCKGDGSSAFERGYLDGLAMYCPRAGIAEGRAGQRYDAGVCATTPEVEASYRRTYRRAIREFCVPSVGWNRGVSGESYGGGCPADLESDFIEFYHAGVKARGLRNRIAERQKARDRHEEEMWKKREQGDDAKWERDSMRAAERDVQELTRQLTVIEARYQRL